MQNITKLAQTVDDLPARDFRDYFFGAPSIGYLLILQVRDKT